MASLVFASGSDISHWAATRVAQGLLPELLRRLVYATTRAPSYVDFPGGDAIQLGGADGVVELVEGHSTIPTGVSLWEMGTDANPKHKADVDYEKRTAAPPTTGRGVISPSDTTFVFVTPRRWGAKDKWANRRRAEKIWKDVRVLDADDLESWLQQASAVHVWLSRIIGRLPAGADDVETVWNDWAQSITPPANTALILAGREGESAELFKWLGTCTPGCLTVSAESASDALGVIAATMVSLPDSERVRIIARTVVLSTADTFIELSASPEPLILIPTYVPGNEINRAIRAGHQVVIPSPPISTDSARAPHLKMPRVTRHDATKALIAMGLTEERSRELAGIGRRSMLTLRRRLATHPSLQTPEWAAPSVGPSLVPMLLLGQFNERYDADLQVLGSLTSNELAATRQTLRRWSEEIDPPIRRVGDIWYLVSKEDAWAILSRYVSAEDLKRFATAALDVLREVHPKFDLPPDQRWAASIHGKERQYSGTLVTGIADTIALLGALASSVTVQGGVAPTVVADRIVRDLFDAIAGDWRGWATLSSILPLLAEGAPNVFLNAVDSQVANAEEAVKALFRDEGDVMLSSSSHTGLLWALETLAWSPDHLASTARLLATLDRLDPGGRITNRPGNSLRSIFLFWLPQTSADVETRLNVLRQLRNQEPEAAWRLFASLLPRLSDHSTYNPRPKWRDWGTAPPATNGDIYQQTSTIVEWMIEDAGENSLRWVTLIESLDKVRRDDFNAIIASLTSFLQRVTDDEIRAPIFDALRDVLSRHRSFASADWALSKEPLDKLEALFISATPREPFARYRWLFSQRPQLPEGREQNWEKYQEELAERQREAIRQLYSQFGTDGFVALAARVERPDELGRFLALTGVIPIEGEDRLLERLVGAAEGSSGAFGRGYAYGWTGRIGRDAALQQIRSNAGNWSDEIRGRLLLAQLPDATVLDVVDELGISGQTAFWVGVYPFWFDEPVVERGLRGVLEHERPHAFVDAAAALLRKYPKIDSELLGAALERAARQEADKDGHKTDSHDIGELLNALEIAVKEGRFDEARMAQLEFLYLPILGHFTRQPRMLHSAMAKDPSLFVEAVRISYRGEGEERGNVTPEDIRLAERAHHLVQSWRVPPGESPNGINPEAMNEWVDRARAELRDIGRLDIGDQLIGQVMSGSNFDVDRAWPLIPIRDLIERLKSDDFELGLQIGRFNSRGVITRNPLSGGDVERSEAEAYERMATTTAGRWQRTSAMLRRIALEARAHATHEDIDAELRQELND
jgi:hypothetical protein